MNSRIHERLRDVSECSRLISLMTRRIDETKKIYSEKYAAWHYPQSEFTAKELSLLKTIRSLNSVWRTASWDEIKEAHGEMHGSEIIIYIDRLLKLNSIMLAEGMKLKTHRGTDAILDWKKIKKRG